MNTYSGKAQNNRSQPATNGVSQKKDGNESMFQIENNRPEALVQRELQDFANQSSKTKQLANLQAMADEQAQTATTLNDHNPNPVQRLVSVDLLVDESNKKKIRAEGKVADFSGGTTAGKYGWVGVTAYRSDYKVSDKKYANVGDVGPLGNDFTNPEAGHVLANQNGGDGSDTWNVFAQDGGTNNGKYKSFEIGMRKDLDKYKDNDDVIFTSYLVGDDIEDSGKIKDAGQDDAESISSEDSN